MQYIAIIRGRCKEAKRMKKVRNQMSIVFEIITETLGQI